MKFLIALLLFISLGIHAAPVVVYVNGASNEVDEHIDGSFLAFSNAISKKYAAIPAQDIFAHKVYQTKLGSVSAVACQKTLVEISLPDGLGSVLQPNQKSKYLENLGKNYSNIFNFGLFPQCNGLFYPVSYMRDRTTALYMYVKNNLNNGVLLVGHSQGNFMIEAVLGLLQYNGQDINRVRLINIASMTPVEHGSYINASQDKVLYSKEIYEFYSLSIPMNILWGGLQPYPNYALCINNCSKGATNEELISIAKTDNEAHGIVSTYLNEKIISFEKRKKMPSIIANEVFKNYKLISGSKINLIQIRGRTTVAKYLLNKSLALLGISNATAQSVSDLFAFTSTSYTVRVDGTGFDNKEAVTVEGSTCDVNTIQRGFGYFTQTCQGGSQAGNSYKIRVYDTQYDLEIEVPPGYQYMSLRGPVLAPTAPVLIDLGSGTIRSTWGAVSGATGYELYSGQTLIKNAGASQTTYDHTNQAAGSQVCYRVRTLVAGVASAYSAETCITLAAPTCTGVWTSGQIPVGMFEGTVQNCPTGYTGNKQLRHTCQAGGSWGPIVTENYCTILPTITCAGAWSTAKYQVNQTESKTAACTGGQTGSVITNHICRSNGTFGPTVETISCACPAGKVLLNGVCITPPPTSCNGAWTNTSYAIGAVEEQYASACPVGTVGQVRSFHTCQAGGIWSPTANSDNCTPVLVAPTGLIASSVGVDSGLAGVRLVWTAVSGATNYIINRNGSANYSSLAGTTWTDPYVTAGIQYCYTVNAFSSFNNTRSPDSTQFCTTYQPTQNTIQPPTNFAAGKGTNANGQKGIVLSWTAALGADSYLIYRRGYSNPYTSAAFLAPTNGADVSFVDLWSIFSGSIVTGQSYCYFIRAQKNGTSSLDSNEGCSVAP